MAWTAEQLTAIQQRRTMLVSAAAGSGKTSVLSNRVLEYVRSGGSLDRLLIATFTELAAGEMRDRIGKLLRSDDCGTDIDHVRRQRLLLYKARIGTIDSLFGSIVRKNFRVAGVNPDFSVLSAGESRLMRSEILDGILEKFCAERSREYETLVAVFGGDDREKSLSDAVNSIYDKAMSMPFPGKWLDMWLGMYSDIRPWITAVSTEIRGDLESVAAVYDGVLASGTLNEKVTGMCRAERSQFESVYEKLEADPPDWDAVCAAANFGMANMPSKGGIDKSDPWNRSYGYYRGWVRNNIFGTTDADKNAELYRISLADAEKDMEAQRPAVKCLFDIVGEYISALRAQMDRRNRYSFNAVAQMALALVVKEESFTPECGDFEVTPIALEIRREYDEVLVDEYQDTNALQDCFFRAIAPVDGNGPRFFAVGDVKQSIYNFRNAEPENFIRRGREMDTVWLNSNFRSRKGVLDFTNFVCSQLFSERTGGVCYSEPEPDDPFGGKRDKTTPLSGEDHVLRHGNTSYPGKEEPDAEVYFTDCKGNAEEKAFALAGTAAERILQMMQSMTVGPSGQTRPLRYSDIAVLTPKLKGVASVYMQVFERAGIPCVGRDNEPFLCRTEANIIMALLQVIDDPFKDIPLFAVMFSELFGFSADELARIRLYDRKGAFYEAVRKAAEDGDDKADAFVAQIEKYRLLADDFPVYKLIWRIYTDTGYPDAVSCLPAGAQRRATLMQLYDFARDYCSRTEGGLYRFLKYAEAAAEEETVPGNGEVKGNFVRIMTVHGSKGLEFPVCIFCVPQRRGSESKPVLFDPEYGVAAKIRDKNRFSQQNTLMTYTLKYIRRRKEASEELRKLYVAMTRAREKLVIISEMPSKGDIEAAQSDIMMPRPSPLNVTQNLSVPGLLYASVLRHPDFDPDDISVAKKLRCESPAKILYGVLPPDNVQAQTGKAPEGSGADITGEELDRRFSYRYHASSAPAKVSVTEVAKNKLYDGEQTVFEEEFAAPVPEFVSADKSGTRRGTAIHTYLSFADPGKDMDSETERLVREGLLSHEQAEYVSLYGKNFEIFARSELYVEIKRALRIRREENFVVRIPASRIGRGGDETVIMQGALDLLCEYSDGYVVVDYKTDHADESQLRQRYSEQLRCYGYAVEKCYGPVKKLSIWSFFLGKEIIIPPEGN